MNLTKPQKLIYDMEKFAGRAISIVCGSMLIKTDKSVDEMKKAVNELYHLNDALRIRVSEENGQPYQYITEYQEQEIEVLSLNSKEELDDYASEYAKEPLDFYDSLCDVKIIVLPDRKGLLAKLHHFVSDAWTLSLLGTQFNTLLKGEEVKAYSYSDYVIAEELYAEGKRYAKDKDYFISQFKKCDEVTYLSDKQSHSYDASRATFIIDYKNAAKINKFVTEHETSVFNLFMAALAIYINRTKMNTEKFYIGTAVLNRNGIKEQNTMGMFINTAPVLLELSNEGSFAENLETVQDSIISVLRHQKYNYGTLLEELRKKHSFSEKLYDVILSYQNAKVLGSEIETTWYHSGMQTESLQIHIDDRDSEGIFRVHYDYLIEKFSENEIKKIHEHICNLLFDAIENSGKKLYELEILSEDEKKTLLFDFNNTTVEYPKDKCIHQLIEEQVEKNPDKVAVVACDKTLTYKELNEKANKIAHSLIEKGVGRGDIVAIILPRESHLIPAMLGVLKSGAAYMPVDPDYPQDRIDYMLSDSNSKFCVTEENISELLDNSNTENLNINSESSDNCYCIYTSGSTGKPKGTLLTHKNVGNYVHNNNIVHKIIKESYQNIVSVTTVGFDIFVTESLLPLSNGMEIVLANEEQAKLQNRLNDLIKAKPVDVLQTTPTKMKSLIVDKEQLDYLKTIKVVILGGEALEETLVEELKKLTDAEIYNIYGPTEATVWVTNTHISTSYEKESTTNIKGLFENVVLRKPDDVALVAKDKTLTFRELNEISNKIAHSLTEKGIGKGDIVAFSLTRKSYHIATMLGIIKSGAAYLPISLDYPQDRIKYMLEDSKAKFHITEDNISSLLSNSNISNLNISLSETDTCYCIYTSGSTGMPKGVIVNHRNVVNFCVDCNQNHFQHKLITECKSVLSTNQTVFDITLQETLLPLVNGAKVLFADDEGVHDIQQVLPLITEDKIGLILTPTKMKMYLNNSSFCDTLKNFSLIMIGAEELSADLVSRIKKYTDAIIINGYGPTETTCGVTYAPVDAIDIHIGKPIANTQIHIVDKHLKLVPIGVTGELCIAGDCVGVGYLNRPELTAEKFIDNPFGKSKMYKTGDLAYWREDGNIAYVGRNDFQVKIRGLRIELGEIENAISSVDGINMSVVVVRKNSDGRQLICAFYTGEEKTAQEIRSQIGEKLPKYMLPHIFTHLDEMPMTSSGKISRNTLPEIDLENIVNDTEYIAPTTETEKLLCSIVSETLNIEKVGIEDDFFELGGDSLKAIEYVSKAHAQGVYFALQDVFDNPTVKLLCGFMTAKDKQHNSYNKDDFTEIHKMLESNLDDDFVPEKSDMGDVLITGATGFLGIHVVSEFLENESGKIYCLVRGKDDADATARFERLLNYYFNGKYVDLIGNRIIVLCGDVEKQNLGLKALPNVSMVINTAASVKHYGSYKYFHDINVGGAINAMNVAKAVDARFIQVSTLSVSGNSMVDIFDAIRSDEYKTFSENDLYIEQQLDNVYIRSKFEAEYAILKEMLNGMKANIIRVGNLTNRASDFKFQPNYQSNAFLSRVKAVLEMGMFPDYLIDLYAEFSPIDDTAKAVIKIAQHFNDRKTVFHVNSQKVVYFDKFIEYTGKLGINLDVLGGNDFANRLAELEHDETTRYIYEALINDMDEKGNLVYDSNIHIENEHTLKYLGKIGFDWTEIGLKYLKGYFDYFRNIGYLEV